MSNLYEVILTFADNSRGITIRSHVVHCQRSVLFLHFSFLVTSEEMVILS
jgi:hypothetical protein